ncbi:urea amidolyase family protein (plasmid) [Deinococcus taeanensis]|uniref:5-oxoprolinase subunit B/C family protein n=1 Tax=Deinococcus taeanensis TaxID=2737050 RepID=UPI001CDBD7BC|nr:urea amidolyase family protein [Deinococcus taeanensis]UBV44522.1 urea amidolyase family protein [Deinococcus taeanensis]
MRRLEGFYVAFGTELNRADNLCLHALHRALRGDLLPGVTDLYPGYVNLYVEYDAVQTDRATVSEWVRKHLPAARGAMPEARPPVTIPVRYDGEDLADVASRTGMSEREVIRLHTGPDYHVYAVGFTPGFPFLGEVPGALRLPRRDTPRLKVPFNAVAVANAQSCVYVLPSPGGWHLLGTALTTIYDPNRTAPFLLSPGDTVRFAEATGDAPELPGIRPLWPDVPARPALRVEKAGLLDLLVDEGRFLQAHHGMARSGPLDERAAALANHVAGNPPGTPLLELTLLGPTLTALQDVVLAAVGYGMTGQVAGRPVPAQAPFVVRAGDTLRFTPTGEGARCYLAVAGGLDTRPFLGSSSVDRTGRVGRPLRAGDVLGLGRAPVRAPGATAPLPQLPAEVTLRLLPGPQATYEALVALGRAPFRVREGDRMGIRLEGPAVPGGQVVSEATPHGAVQVTPAGQAIMLLNDRGRIGGYHKPAVIHPDDLPLAAQLRPNQRVHFRPHVSGRPDSWPQRWFMPV